MVNTAFALHEGWILERLRRSRGARWHEALRGQVQWGAGWPQMLGDSVGWVALGRWWGVSFRF